MADVADYRVIEKADGQPVILRTGGDIDESIPFDLGTDVKHNQFAVLQCFFETTSTANNLSFRFTLNGTDVRTLNVTGREFATINVARKNVTRNKNNELRIRIAGGTGAVTVRDIVLFVQRSV
jgi:hypothetical protein